MKRIGFLTEKIAEFDNLCEAFRKAVKGKQRKREVLDFREHFDDNIVSLQKQILSGDIRLGVYHTFTIYEPKERIISAATFKDRVLHHAIINVCHELFDRSLIDTTYATRRHKGVYAAIDKAVEGLTKYRFSVKLDVRKYYDSINHEILKGMLRRKFKDRKLLAMFDAIIDSRNESTGCGLPIGNLTSQYFANLYLSSLDHYVKEQLKAPLYIRYMDDMLIADNSLQRLKEIVGCLTAYAGENLQLGLKPPVYRRSSQGQVFLGYKVLPYRYELAGRSKKRFRAKLMTYDRFLATNQWSEQTYMSHITPLIAFAGHAVSHEFRKDCLRLTVG